MSAINITTTATAAPTIQLTQARDAYQLALATGFIGTLAEWQESQKGADGVAGANGPAGPNSVTSATSSDGTANLSVASITTNGATLYSDPLYGSITASAGPDGQPEFTVGSITLRESDGTVRTGFLEATEGLKIGNISAQATGIALLGSETASAARVALGLGTAQSPTFNSVTFPGGGTISQGVGGSLKSSGSHIAYGFYVGGNTTSGGLFPAGAGMILTKSTDVAGNLTASGTVTANSGLAVTSTSYPVLDVTRSTAATGDFRAATRFKRANSSGTSSAGMGVGCFFEIPNAANNLKNVGFFGGAIATATAGAEVGEMVFAPAWQGVDPYQRRDMVLRATGAATADLLLSGNLTASGTVTANSLALTTPLPITSGGTGATTASAARTALGLGTGEQINAILETLVAKRTTDSDARTTNSYAAEDALAVNVAAGSYIVDFMLFFVSAAGGYKARLNFPTLPTNTCAAGWVQNESVLAQLTGTSTTTIDTIALRGAATTGRVVTGSVRLTFTGTGSIAVEWAQTSSDPAGTILKAGSFIKVSKI